MAVQEEIRRKIEAKLEQMGLELFEIKYMPSGPHSVLRIYIDKEAGVTIDDCEAASNEISVLLDVEDFSKTPYRLEVSSPGADRILKSERDFRRTLGKTVRAEIAAPDGKLRTVTGKVLECGDGVVRIENEHGTTGIPLADIRYAKIEFSFK